MAPERKKAQKSLDIITKILALVGFEPSASEADTLSAELQV